MSNLIYIGIAEKKVGSKKFLFHFRGVLAGEEIIGVLVYTNQIDIKLGQEYALYLRHYKIVDKLVVAELIKARIL